jgi:hypothetical protein
MRPSTPRPSRVQIAAWIDGGQRCHKQHLRCTLFTASTGRVQTSSCVALPPADTVRTKTSIQSQAAARVTSHPNLYDASLSFEAEKPVLARRTSRSSLGSDGGVSAASQEPMPLQPGLEGSAEEDVSAVAAAAAAAAAEEWSQ